MKKIILTLALILASITTTFAQTSQTPDYDRASYKIELQKLLEATKSRENMVTGMAITWEQMQSPMSNYNAAAEAVVAGIWPDVLDIFTDEYMKYFTIDDICELNAFYNTPVGLKWANASNKLTQAGILKVNERLGDKIVELITPFIIVK